MVGLVGEPVPIDTDELKEESERKEGSAEGRERKEGRTPAGRKLKEGHRRKEGRKEGRNLKEGR